MMSNLHQLLQIALVAQLIKNLPAMQETLVRSLVGKIHWRRDRLPTAVFLGFPCGSADKESTCHAGDLGLIPGLGRSPGEGKGYPLQCSDLENSMDLESPWGLKELDRTEQLSLLNWLKRLGRKELIKTFSLLPTESSI